MLESLQMENCVNAVPDLRKGDRYCITDNHAVSVKSI